MIEDIQNFDFTTLQPSSFLLFLGKRRSGKSVLAEYLIYQMIENKSVDQVFLFSKTNAGFKIVQDHQSRFQNIENLQTIVDNYKTLNDYNKVANKSEKVDLSTIIIIDDFAVDLKSKDFNILEELAVNGRHLAYPPLNLTFIILVQSLTKIPRVVRLNCDCIFLNAIASEKERSLILDENLYLIDGSREGKNIGRNLYQDLVASEDFVFMVIENYKQNCKCYGDYIKKYKADITKLNL